MGAKLANRSSYFVFSMRILKAERNFSVASLGSKLSAAKRLSRK